MFRYILVLLVIFNFSFCITETGNEKSLIVAEYKRDKSGVGDYTYLVSYNFREGKLISKDTILGSVQEPDDNTPWFHVRYDLGHNFIYQNRYVVSGVGNVIDTKTKLFVMKASDEFIEANDDTLLFHRNNTFSGTGYLKLDLKSGYYEFVKDKNFRSVKGEQSPDHTHGLDIVESKIPRAIILYDQNNKVDTIVKNCGYGTPMSMYSSSHSKVPVFWIDNFTFLYAEFTSKFVGHQVTIRKFNIDTKANEIIGVADSLKEAVSNAKFWKEDDGTIAFFCTRGLYKIDYVNNTMSHYSPKKIENGFEVIHKGDKDVIKYNDANIGTIISGDHVTTNGYFAAEYGVQNSNMPYPKGIKVWNNITKEWTTIDIPWVSAIIGWIDK